MTDTLGDALPREMSRVRDEVMPVYQDIGQVGVFALALMRQDLDAAQKAIIEGDLPEMIRCYESLRGFKI